MDPAEANDAHHATPAEAGQRPCSRRRRSRHQRTPSRPCSLRCCYPRLDVSRRHPAIGRGSRGAARLAPSRNSIIQGRLVDQVTAVCGCFLVQPQCWLGCHSCSEYPSSGRHSEPELAWLPLLCSRVLPTLRYYS